MKLDEYNVAQSSQSIEELTKGFFQYMGLIESKSINLLERV